MKCSFMNKLVHRIVEYLQLEETYKDHRVQAPAFLKRGLRAEPAGSLAKTLESKG